LFTIMRTPRIVILAAFFFTTIILTSIALRSSKPEPTYTTSEAASGRLRRIFSFHTPLSLFPPNAIISLTDDNTTSFLARPAAFGPLLPAKGLSGQLWIGSGFGDDRQGTIAAGAEGELGCSDVPGWVDGNKKIGSSPVSHKIVEGGKGSASGSKAKSQRRRNVPDVDRSALPGHFDQEQGLGPSVDDGTDDYLHHSPGAHPTIPGQAGHHDSTTQSNHADIQSIQEGAEITGKVVLLSRGGCGFLEKVKWTQRRGGIALIVGDDTRGGPLIQMYARGDTSNVTIPSIFTSHTTAHLLSSLIPPGSFIEDSIDENGRAAVKVQQSKKPKKGGKKGSKASDGNGKNTPRPGSKSSSGKATVVADKKAPSSEIQKPGWLRSLFSKPKTTADPKIPDISGKLDWVLVDEWDESADVIQKSPKVAPPKSAAKQTSDQPESHDDFVIGVHDWRDPDLVAGPARGKAEKEEHTAQADKNSKGASSKKPVDGSSDKKKTNPSLGGGSITPGSGEYKDGFPAAKGDIKETKGDSTGDISSDKDKSGLLTKIFGDDDDESDVPGRITTFDESHDDEEIFDESDDQDEPEHEGLWVTLTPTTGASPFFDTLLVLVVSPLVTLTVVYALLLLRSRIRRRRWRAPKSVVDRLPVRTYQTVTSTSGSRLPSPTSSSPTTPLLQHRPRPRSRTTSGLPEPGLLLRANSDLSSRSSRPPSRGPEPEKTPGVASEWKKYMGKQVECVVCLEEYVDGVSRVMSLPCGHEFHVDCM
jgi:hypothetical protein